MKAVGIDIGTYSIKISEMELISQNHRLNAVYQIPLSIDPKADRKIEIVEALRQISKKYENQSVQFVLAIPQNKISSRKLSFPFKERHKILKSLPFELEEDIPFSFGNAIFDARITAYAGNFSEVLATATPFSYIEEMIDLAKDGAIDMQILSVEGLAFANIFEKWNEVPRQKPASPVEDDEDDSDKEASKKVILKKEAQIVLDLGYSKTLVLIISEEQLVDIRTIDFGGKDLALALSHSLGMHYTEAIKELEKRASLVIDSENATEEQLKTSQILKQKLDSLNHQLHLILLDLESEHNFNFTQISLMGGLSQLKNIGAYITQGVEIPCNRFHYTQLLPNTLEQPSLELELVSAVSSGLAIEAFRKARNPAINLLTGLFKRSSKNLEKYWQKWGTLTKFVAATYILFFVYSCARDQIATDISYKPEDLLKNTAKKVLTNKKDAKSLSKIKMYIKKQEKLIAQKENVATLDTFVSPLTILKDLTLKSPKLKQMKMNIHDLEIQGNQFIIKGELAPFAIKANFESVLKALSQNKKLNKVDNSHPTSAGFSSFGYKINVKRIDKGESL